MSELTRPIRRLLGRDDRAGRRRAGRRRRADRAGAASADAAPADDSIAVDIAESDPLLAYLQTAPGPVDLATLELDSPGRRATCARPASRSSSRWSRRAS